MKICNLYTLTEYSFLKSTIKIEKLIDFKKHDNQNNYISISDNNLSGYYKFNKLALDNNLKPLFGFELKISDYDFLVYIKNNQGYYDLLTINNLIINKEKVDLQVIKKFQDNLIFILLTENISLLDIRTEYEFFKSLKNFYIQYNEYNNITNIYSLSDFKYIPVLKQTYLTNDEKDAYLALSKLDSERDKSHFYRYFSSEEFFNFYNINELYLNLNSLIESIDFSFPKLNFSLPIFSSNSYDLLRNLLYKGLEEKKLINNTKYIERVKNELKIINDLNFVDYFLIVHDIINYAKNNDILVGPGRGSAVGSLISYLLNITEVDPLKYDLYFERFLNPFRKTMPDIDIDFPDDKREEVIKYCIEKYGLEKVCLISTYDTFQTKSITRELVKQYDIKDYLKNQIIDQITNDHPDLENDIVKDILEKSKYLKGLIRNRSTHASGVIISNKDLTASIPLVKYNEKYFQSQFEMNEIESMGLLKIDFLGLKNLTIINQIIKLIKVNEQDFNILNISLDDKKTYELINSLDTAGIFQLETRGIKSVINKVKIDEFEDLVSILALFRPGPMDNIDLFAYNKNNQNATYLHPDLIPILKKTYGIIVYQEQIMEICQKVAGYTLAEADLFRRAISKKDENILDLEKPKFINSCIKNGYEKVVVEKLFDYIYKFANYGFNRSHSVSYALLSYRMSYLKANYPMEFYTVLLNNSIGNEQDTKFYLTKLLQNKVNIYPPLINKSGLYYKINKNNVLLPLTIIKSVPEGVIIKILEERNVKEFLSFSDFKTRCKDFIDENILKQLIYADSFSLFEKNIHKLLKNTNVFKLNIDFSLFNLEEIEQESNEVLSLNDKINFEMKAFGFNIFNNLFSEIDRDILSQKGYKKIISIKDSYKILSLVEILSIKEIKTKDNNKMAFILVSDGIYELELTCFSEVYNKLLKIIGQNYKNILFSVIIKKSNINNRIYYYLEDISKFI